MIRVLCIGDSHSKLSNVPLTDMLIEKLFKLAQEQKPDLIVHLGDINDTFERMHITTQNRCNNMIRALRKVAPTVVLVGNHSFCVGRDVSILLYNGTTKLSQKIKKGDTLTGDDNLPRKVLRTWKGKSEMYQIKQSNGMTYTVTPDHILCLKSKHHRRMTWNETENKCEVSWFEDDDIETKVFDSRDGNKRYSKQDLLRISEAYLNYVAPNNVIEMSARQLYSTLSVDAASKLCGYKISVSDPNDCTLSELTVTKLEGLHKYYGIEVDGNNRYLLADRTVTHNCNNQQFLTDEHSLDGLKEWANVTVVDRVISQTIQGVNLVFVPYVPPGRFIEALDTIGDSWKTADCIFCHQEFFNCKMGAIVSTEGDKWPAKNPFVISGHIHLKQRLQKNIYYPGSSIQVAFGENETKIIPILAIESGQPVEIEEFDLKLPKKKIVYMDVEKLDEYIPPENTTDDIKVSVSGSYDQFKALKKTAKYKELEKQGLQVVFKPKKLKKVDKKDISPAVDSSINFNEILTSMVTETKDPYLYQAYEYVVNNNQIKEDSVMFL